MPWKLEHPGELPVCLWEDGFLGANGKEFACAGDARGMCSIPGLQRSPGGRKWQPTPVFLPEESHRPEESMGSQRV